MRTDRNNVEVIKSKILYYYASGSWNVTKVTVEECQRYNASTGKPRGGTYTEYTVHGNPRYIGWYEYGYTRKYNKAGKIAKKLAQNIIDEQYGQ